MGTQSTVRPTVTGPVLRLTLSRPEKRNAFDEPMIEALEAEAVRAAEEDAVRVVILDGDGPTFCAGADIDWMRRSGSKSAADNRKSAARMAAMFEALDALPMPLVGRVHGACLGGGVGLLAVCDVVVAEASCTFAMSEVRLGIIPAVIAPYVTARIGPGRARELMLSGRRFTSEEAERIGLVHLVAGTDTLDDAIRDTVHELLQGAPGAQRHLKKFLAELELRRARGEPLGPWTAEEIARARSTPEAREGLAAFLNREAPPWRVEE